MPRDVSLSDSKCLNGGHEWVKMQSLLQDPVYGTNCQFILGKQKTFSSSKWNLNYIFLVRIYNSFSMIFYCSHCLQNIYEFSVIISMMVLFCFVEREPRLESSIQKHAGPRGAAPLGVQGGKAYRKKNYILILHSMVHHHEFC